MLNTPLEFNYETASYFLHIHMHMWWRHLSINISFPYNSMHLACSKCGGLLRWLITLFILYKYSYVNRSLYIYISCNVLGCSKCGDFRMFLNIAPSVLKTKKQTMFQVIVRRYNRAGNSTVHCTCSTMRGSPSISWWICIELWMLAENFVAIPTNWPKLRGLTGLTSVPLRGTHNLDFQVHLHFCRQKSKRARNWGKKTLQNHRLYSCTKNALWCFNSLRTFMVSPLEDWSAHRSWWWK